jgi:hypothetical protein
MSVKLISLAALVALTIAMRAQGPLVVTASTSPSVSLSGFVRDESNNPVQATVTIATQGLRQSQLTAADGSFSRSDQSLRNSRPAFALKDGQPGIFRKLRIFLRQRTTIENRTAIGANDLDVPAGRTEANVWCFVGS